MRGGGAGSWEREQAIGGICGQRERSGGKWGEGTEGISARAATGVYGARAAGGNGEAALECERESRPQSAAGAWKLRGAGVWQARDDAGRGVDGRDMGSGIEGGEGWS